LGAGIAGLGAALRAREVGREAVIFEARKSAGGLLDNFVIDGYRFDYAVHLSFAQEPLVRKIFDKTPYITHPADSTCFDDGLWLKHPVQNNLCPLPPDEKVRLIESFLKRPEQLHAPDYESWLRHQYGNAIAERYPLRYTMKYWGTPAAELSTTWIGNRMRRAALAEILYGAFTEDTPNTYYTKEMRYPEKGGYKAFIQELIDESTIEYGRRVTAIDVVNKSVTFADGSTVRYTTLVSSLPLPVIAKLIQDCPRAIMEAAEKLEATSIDLVSVGFKRPVVQDLWFYIYDDDILASRAYSPSVKSPDNAPPGSSSLQFEIYNRGRQPLHSAEELKENVLYAIAKMKIASGEDIAVLDHRRIEFGNVIFDKGMEDQRSVVMDYLHGSGISSCGRFGTWDYLWSNQSLISGYEALK
jgi:protoporphyrinogen oxidase